MEGLVTENLHLSAYALANGARLKAVSVSRTNGRRTVIFELEAAYMHRLADEYYGQAAIVNLADYRRCVEELKDELFGALREDERKTRSEDGHHQRQRRHHQQRSGRRAQA